MPADRASTVHDRAADDRVTFDLAPARRVLREVWGYETFRPLQAEAVTAVLQHRDSVVVLPTGGGKSLCFQVPAIVDGGLAVVVSPLISLMKDQVDALRANGVAAALVNSTQSQAQKNEVAAQIARGELSLLYMAPERLLIDRTLDFLQKVGVSFFAIDEAHCVSNWGHDFRPEYRGLGILKDRFPDSSIHALTATASQRVREDIAEQLRLDDPEILVGSFDRPNLIYRMRRADSRLDQVIEVIDRHPKESGIVYAITRKEVDQIAAALKRRGVDARPYHAGLSDHERAANQEAFLQDACDVIVATVAFGMGIDKANVRYVIHAGMPKSIEHYQQESGRAGRDGLPAECVLMFSGGDVMTWKRILENGDSNNFASAMASVDAMADLAGGVHCRHAAIVEYFGESYPNQRCDACDVCLDELDQVAEPVILAQKILSCVVRIKQRFAAGHTAKVLTGSKDSRIVQYGHDRLSTYGLLSQHPAAVVRQWIDQLVGQGFLIRHGEFQQLGLSESGRELMAGRGDVILTRPPAKKTKANREKPSESWEGVDRDLFETLRARRTELSQQRGVPAYIIFGDGVLRDLARVRPGSLAMMGTISGVGQMKLKELGKTFLAIIDEHCDRTGLSRDNTDKQPSVTMVDNEEKPSSGESFGIAKRLSIESASERFRQGQSIEQVAEAMGLRPSTVSGYLEHYLIENGVTDPGPWVPRPIVSRVEAALVGMETEALRPVYDALDGQVPYEQIRTVRACQKNRHRLSL